MATKKKATKKKPVKETVFNRFDVYLDNDGTYVTGKVYAVIIDPLNAKKRLDIVDEEVFQDIDYREEIPSGANMDEVEENEFYPAFVDEDGGIKIYGAIPPQWVEPAMKTIESMYKGYTGNQLF